jgi:hypothetical protein
MSKTFWLYSHNLTNTGAPLVLAAIARELAAEGWQQHLRLLSWGGLHDRRHSQLQHELAAEGIAVDVLDAEQMPPKPQPGDRVLLNSLALPEAVVQRALAWKAQGCLDRLDWYAHEGDPWVWLPDPAWPERLRQGLDQGMLQIRVPSRRTREIYATWLDWSGPALAVQWPRLLLPEQQLSHCPPSDDLLRLQLTGMAGCGQKGHLWVLRWIEAALAEQPQGTSGLRDLQLVFIGLESGPYAAFTRELCRRGKELLGEQFSWHAHGSREQALAAMAQADLAVSCSLSETFSLVAAEAMALGKPLLRNRTGGWHEQLRPGITGFDLGEPGPELCHQQVELLQRLRDPERTPTAELLAMGSRAQKQAQDFEQVKYRSWLCGEMAL